jgi:hypothetical protein
VQRISLEAVQLYRRIRELEAEGLGPHGSPTWEEHREARCKLEIRLLGRRPWQCGVVRHDEDDLRDTRPDWDAAGAVALRRQLDEAIAS